MKKIFALLILLSTMFSVASAAQIETEAKSVLLMEQSTGKILHEENADQRLPIASVTKVMTMLLCMEAIDSGQFKVTDTVIASERAKSMGGSTIFLDTGEEMTVDDLLKGIAVASGNDASVAIGEFISGSETEFVALMNRRAAELGMSNTNFANTNGLPAPDHYSSARDVAIMSRELLKHPGILKYTSIWMDSLRNGQFTLANTNKLIRFYSGANGLKTGSTDEALYCVSATAKRDNLQLIAVVLGSPTSAKRFGSASNMLDYGFAAYAMAKVASAGDVVAEIPVSKSVNGTLSAVIKEDFYAAVQKTKINSIQAIPELPAQLAAPIAKDAVLGKMRFVSDGEVLGECPIVAADDAPQMSYFEMLQRIGKTMR